MESTRQGSGTVSGWQPEHQHSQQDVRRMPRRNNWMMSSDEALVDILVEECSQYNTCNGSFRPEAWVRVWNVYQRKTNEDITVLQLKGRWKTLKKLYRLYSSLCNKSGWSWGFDNHRPTPGCPTVWEEIITVNKEYKVCKDKPFPLFLRIHDLVSSSSATEEYARSTGGGVNVADPVDLDEYTDSSDSPAHDEVGNDTVSMHQGVKNISHMSGSKRKQVLDPSPSVSKRMSSEQAVEALDKLIVLTDRRSRVTEQRLEEDERFSFSKCMDKLKSLPDISDDMTLAAIEALKTSREYRIVFLTMRQPVIDRWLYNLVNESRRQD